LNDGIELTVFVHVDPTWCGRTTTVVQISVSEVCGRCTRGGGSSCGDLIHAHGLPFQGIWDELIAGDQFRATDIPLSSRPSVAHQSVNKRLFKFLLPLTVYGSDTEKSWVNGRTIRLYAAQSIAGTVPSD
jgi:hypothetical protein